MRLPGALGHLPLPTALALVHGEGEAGVPSVLGARYNGGKTLAGATLVGSFYEDGSGNRLLVDAGYSEGDTIGTRRLYTAHGVAVGTVVGSPGGGLRRSGLTDMSGSDYFSFNLGAADEYSFVARFRLTAAPSAGNVILSKTTTSGDYWLIQIGTGRRVTFTVNGVTATLTGTTLPVGTWYLVSGRVYHDGGNVHMVARLYTDAGAYIETATATKAAASWDGSGAYYLGRGAAGGGAVDIDVDRLMAWDGVPKDSTAQDAVALLLAGGGSIAAAFADYPDCSLPTDGIITGAYDAGSPTVLYPSTGLGDEVTAEYA